MVVEAFGTFVGSYAHLSFLEQLLRSHFLDRAVQMTKLTSNFLSARTLNVITTQSNVIPPTPTDRKLLHTYSIMETVHQLLYCIGRKYALSLVITSSRLRSSSELQSRMELLLRSSHSSCALHRMHSPSD